jgi:hypothetical protein
VVAGIVFAVDANDAKSRTDADKQLSNLALQTYEWRLNRYEIESGGATIEEIYTWSKRAMEADSDHKEAAGAHLKRMTNLEKLATKLKDAHQISLADFSAATYYRLEAEILAGRFE